MDDKIDMDLMVRTDGSGHVILSLRPEHTGHFIFSPIQASELAKLLHRKAVVGGRPDFISRVITEINSE